MNKWIHQRWGWTLMVFLLAACSKRSMTSTPFLTPTPSKTPTQVPTHSFTVTPVPPTPSPSPVPTATVTPKPITETFTDATSIYFVSETIPDNTRLEPGQAFTKTWTIGNGGPGVWTSGYDLFLVSSNPTQEHLGAPESTLLSQEVKPGEEITISLGLVAPNQGGLYTVVWRLRNERGEWVLGSDLWVIIRIGDALGAGATTTGDVTAVLSGASQQAGEVSVDFCTQMPDSLAWYPWEAVLIINQQPFSPSGSRIDPATATGTYKCFSFRYPVGNTIASGTSYQLSIGNVGLPPEVHQAENCAHARQLLIAAYPGLDFTCAGPGFWYTNLVTPPGMTVDQADRLILDAMSSTIYGPWTLNGTVP